MRAKLILLFLYVTGHSAHAFILPPPSLSSSILRRHPPSVATLLRCSAASSADVAEVLELVKGTDRGADARALPIEKRRRLYAVLDKLEAEGWAGPDVDGGLVASGGPGIGNFECVFVGEKDASSEVGQTGSSQAGGYWRGSLGRLLLQTVALYQNLVYCGEGEDGGEIPPYTLIGLQENARRQTMRGGKAKIALGVGSRPSGEVKSKELIVINMICLKLFSLIPITVILAGIATRLTAEQRGQIKSRGGAGGGLVPLTGNTARVDFANPVIAFGPPWLARFLKVSLGPATDVFIDTPYAWGGLRLGRGGTSGSRFCFERVDDAGAEGWRAIIGSPPPIPGRTLGVLLMTSLVLRFALIAAKSAGGMAAKCLTAVGPGGWGGGLALLLVAAGLLMSGGGVVEGMETSS